MKKRLNLIKAVILGAPLRIFAQQNVPPPITSLGGFIGYLCTAINWLFTFLIVLAIVFVLVAAFKYLTAAGDPEKVKAASHQLIYAAVAVAVAIVAKGVPLIIGSFFTGGQAGFQAC